MPLTRTIETTPAQVLWLINVIIRRNLECDFKSDICGDGVNKIKMSENTARTLQRALGTHSSPVMKAITAAFGDLPPPPAMAYGYGPGCSGIAGKPAPRTTYHGA